MLGLKAIVVEHRDKQVWSLLLPTSVQASGFSKPRAAWNNLLCVSASLPDTRTRSHLFFSIRLHRHQMFFLRIGWGSREEMNLKAKG